MVAQLVMNSGRFMGISDPGTGEVPTAVVRDQFPVRSRFSIHLEYIWKFFGAQRSTGRANLLQNIQKWVPLHIYETVMFQT